MVNGYSIVLPMVSEEPDTVIFVTGNITEVIGNSQVLVLKNPLGSKHYYKGMIGARKLRLDIYLPGDTFRMKK